MPIILIALASTLFFVFTNPIYNDVSVLRAQMASYNEALNNSKTLDSERDSLTAQYNQMNPDDLSRLQKLLPDNVDNIRLILEIEQIAAPYGMSLTNIKYDASSDTNSAGSTANGTIIQGGSTNTSASSKSYGVFNLEFSTSGTYDNFINFTKDLENNLRIVDISSISFSSDASNTNTSGTSTGKKVGTNTSEVYNYDFKIETYWLKN